MSAVLSVLYLLPDAGPPGYANLDKLTHSIAFAAIGVATWPATQRWKGFCYLLLAGCALGIGLECLQSLVPSREFSALDMLANIVGIAAGAPAGWRLGDVLTRVVEVRRTR